MKNISKTFAMLVVAGGSLSGCLSSETTENVQTSSVQGDRVEYFSTTKHFLKEVGRTNPPIGHYEYCMKNVSECQAYAGYNLTSEILWNDEIKSVIENVNDFVNENIAPLTDEQIHGVEELWTNLNIDGTKIFPGDCEDYVLAKRSKLIEKGFPAGALSINVVLQADGTGHAVLAIQTSEGTLILDNLDKETKWLNETPYRYIKKQSSKHAGHWEKVKQIQVSSADLRPSLHQ